MFSLPQIPPAAPRWYAAAIVTEPARYTDRHFRGLERGELDPAGAIFLGCTFEECDLSEADFSGAQLAECSFDRCELAVVTLAETVLQDVKFESSRLSGVNFSVVAQGAIGIQARFSGCDLSFSSFRNLDLTDCSFRDCVAREADFQRCNLEKVSFAGCDLGRCVFSGNNLKQADLRSAKNYWISAHDNRIRGLRVTLPEALGLLSAIEVQLE